MPALVDASDELDPSKLRGADGTIDLEVDRSGPSCCRRAASAVTRALDGIRAAPSSTWLGAVDSARSDLLDQRRRPRRTPSTSANVAAQVLPPMLGADGPRTYMVGFQNEAELRGTGGLPGAFAILQADQGKLKFTRFESDNTLVRRIETPVDFGEDYRRLWQRSATRRSTTATATSARTSLTPAQIWQAQWKDYSGQTLDGAITLDPTALSYLLKVTGPTRMKGGVLVSATTSSSLTQNDVYEKYGTTGEQQRKGSCSTWPRPSARS